MYTIGQISEMFQIPVSTLRYYDKEGLFPGLERSGGIRKFTEKEMEALRVIECLKRSGLEIREIKTFMEWCSEGSSTYPKRKELFIRQEEAVKEEMHRLEKTLAMIRYKRWYYEQAIEDGCGRCLRKRCRKKYAPHMSLRLKKRETRRKRKYAGQGKR